MSLPYIDITKITFIQQCKISVIIHFMSVYWLYFLSCNEIKLFPVTTRKGTTSLHSQIASGV